jgi:hypothetical protein
VTDDPLTLWHRKRSNEILEAIINDAKFAKRVKRLNLFAVRDSSELLGALQCGLLPCFPLTPSEDLLHVALPMLIRLQALECCGGEQFRGTIERLPQAILHLKTLRLRSVLLPIYKRGSCSSALVVTLVICTCMGVIVQEVLGYINFNISISSYCAKASNSLSCRQIFPKT